MSQDSANSLQIPKWIALVAGTALAIYAVFSNLGKFSDIEFLGTILLLEVTIACLWRYDQRFFPFLIVAFLWAGMHVPLQGAWTSARWLVLGAGAFSGMLIWMKSPRSPFRLAHLLAFFCVGAAFVSASVSSYVQMASLKALSLLLLFLYCSCGVRLAVLGREDRFFRGLLSGCELVTYLTSLWYFALGQKIWGNPNALGVAMGIGVFPILLWGWLTTQARVLKFRRLVALLLCVYLLFFSMSRAGMVAAMVVTVVFCVGLRQYRLLTKVLAAALALIAVAGVVNPAALNDNYEDIRDEILYKGHKDMGVLGSRQTPWQETVKSIKQHPWFGTGYGTSPTGEDPGRDFGKFASSAETVREHGSSYMTIAEWVGLVGILPFLALVALTAANLFRVCVWMRRTANPYHYSIPLAMVLLAGLVHASFEDWLFAVGSYPSIYFWAFAFILVDLMPATAPGAPVLLRTARPGNLGIAFPGSGSTAH